MIQTVCPQCGDVVPTRTGRGRPNIYCSRECRWRAQGAKRILADPPCRHCGNPYQRSTPSQLYCSPQHRRAAQWAKWEAATEARRASGGSCADCGAPASYGTGRRLCVECSTRKRHVWWNRKNEKRRNAAQGRPVVLAEIAARDGGTCHICSQPVDMGLLGDQPAGPTIDHLTPLALGGIHDPANVALAHRICNVRRGTKPLTNGAA